MRALLLAVLATLLLLAGCVGGPVGPGTDEPITPPEPDPIDTPTGECTETRPATYDHPELTTYGYPDSPSDWSASSVKSYVATFEEAYLYGSDVDEQTTYVEVYVNDVTVERYGDAYVVRLTSYTNGGYERNESGETPIEVHWDGAKKPVAYLVTEDRLLRTEGSYDSTPTTEYLDAGETVACY